jgi:membrane protease YdiL (CAAX protease family)
MESAVSQAPPEPPELPEGADPRWPAWYAGTSFVVALIATFIGVGIVAAATGTGPDEETPEFTIAATLMQSVAFVGTAVLFASFTLKPRLSHFGLRRTRLWPAVGWTALAIVAFYVVTAIYVSAVDPDAEQRVTESLGADESTLGLIVAGLMVIVVAPAAEEFFFRGFFYRALRSRFSVLVAAVIDGLLFGAIHYDFSNSDILLILPPLALLGVLFCLIYEKTGSLYPAIAMHALNNAVAYAVQAEAWEVSVVLCPLMIAGCVLAPRLTGPR